MLPVLSLLVLALAVSLDGFGVGVMYGLRKIRIPMVSVIIISICSGLILFGSMQIGVLLLRFINPTAAEWIGAFILVAIGLWAIHQVLMQKNTDRDLTPPTGNEPDGANESDPDRTIVRIELRRLGLVVQILKTPSEADMDRSGAISSSEAVLLGVALSLDAFGAGIGAALIGFSPLLTAVVIALSSGSFILFGLKVGYRFSKVCWLRGLSLIPGCLLIVMGMMKLF